MDMQEQIKTDPKIKTDASSTSGMIFGFAAALCGIAIMVMGTIKIGLIWF